MVTHEHETSIDLYKAFPETPRAVTYAALLMQALSEPARDSLEGLIMTGVHKYQGAVQYFVSLGEAKGKAEGVVRTLRLLGFDVTPDQEERIRTCQDLATLETWYDRIPHITKTDELFTENAA